MTAEDFSPAYWKFRFKFFFRLRVRALLARYPSRFCYYIFPHLLSCFFSQPSKLDGNYITEHWGNGPQPTTFLLFFFSPPRWLPFTAWAVIFQSLSSLLLFLAFSLDHHAEGTLEQRELADLIYLLHRNGVWALGGWVHEKTGFRHQTEWQGTSEWGCVFTDGLDFHHIEPGNEIWERILPST